MVILDLEFEIFTHVRGQKAPGGCPRRFAVRSCFRSLFVSGAVVVEPLLSDMAVAEEEVKHTCSLCNLAYKPEMGRLHGRTFQCVPCASADRLLRRGLGDKSELKSLPVPEQHAFFRKLHQEREANPDSRMNWVTVRAQLISSLTTRQIRENSTTVNEEYLPLSVWLKRGWEKEVVERNPCEFNEKLDCYTYQIPVKAKKWKETYAEVEERVLRQERDATLKRGKKKSTEGEDGDDGDLDVPKAPAAAGKGQSSATAEKKAAKAEAAAQRKVAGTNQKLQILAAKAMAPLAQDLQAVQKLRLRVSADLPEGVQKTYADSVEKLQSWNQAAKTALAQWEDDKVQSGETTLKSLPFDLPELKCLHKTVGEVQSALKALLPPPKPKAEPQKKRKTPADDAASEQTSKTAEPAKQFRRRTKSS